MNILAEAKTGLTVQRAPNTLLSSSLPAANGLERIASSLSDLRRGKPKNFTMRDEMAGVSRFSVFFEGFPSFFPTVDAMRPYALISERTVAGLNAARARGRKGGSPFKMTATKLRLAMAAMGQPETKVGDLCQELGVTRQTLYRHVSPQGELRQDSVKLFAKG